MRSKAGPSAPRSSGEASDLEIIDPVDLAARLMEIDSTSGREGPVVDWMHGFLAGRDWEVRRIPVSAGRDDVFATTSARMPRVILSTHLDTVPPFIPPRLDGDVLRGRGACDAKGIAAAMICAAERLRDQGLPVGLLFVVGEEVTHDGAHAANEFARSYFTGAHDSRILINGEPTESTLAVGTKGAMRVFVRTTGQAAHSAYPHLGHSATRDLVHLLAGLDDLSWPRDELLGETTVNIGHIAGGVADNVMAPSAESRLMIRLVTSPDEAWSVVDRWAHGRATIERGPTVPPVRLGVFPGFATSVAAFATDIPELGEWGRPHLFGPGSIHVAHRDDEHVRIEELRLAVDAYERLGRICWSSLTE
jgi:acetylornithine deacetylase